MMKADKMVTVYRYDVNVMMMTTMTLMMTTTKMVLVPGRWMRDSAVDNPEQRQSLPFSNRKRYVELHLHWCNS